MSSGRNTLDFETTIALKRQSAFSSTVRHGQYCLAGNQLRLSKYTYNRRSSLTYMNSASSMKNDAAREYIAVYRRTPKCLFFCHFWPNYVSDPYNSYVKMQISKEYSCFDHFRQYRNVRLLLLDIFWSVTS